MVGGARVAAKGYRAGQMCHRFRSFQKAPDTLALWCPDAAGCARPVTDGTGSPSQGSQRHPSIKNRARIVPQARWFAPVSWACTPTPLSKCDVGLLFSGAPVKVRHPIRGPPCFTQSSLCFCRPRHPRPRSFLAAQSNQQGMMAEGIAHRTPCSATLQRSKNGVGFSTRGAIQSFTPHLETCCDRSLSGA